MRQEGRGLLGESRAGCISSPGHLFVTTLPAAKPRPTQVGRLAWGRTAELNWPEKTGRGRALLPLRAPGLERHRHVPRDRGGQKHSDKGLFPLSQRPQT